MGSISCCSNNTVCYSSKLLKDEEEVNTVEQEKDLTNDDAARVAKLKYSKKNSFFFDKSNFINMKNKSVFDEYEINDKLGEGKYIC